MLDETELRDREGDKVTCLGYPPPNRLVQAGVGVVGSPGQSAHSSPLGQPSPPTRQNQDSSHPLLCKTWTGHTLTPEKTDRHLLKRYLPSSYVHSWYKQDRLT